MGGWIIQMGHLSHQGAPLGLAVKDQLWRHLFLAVKVPFQIVPMSKAHWSLLPCHLLDLGSPQCLGISELEEISVTSLYDPSLYRWGHCREGKAHFQCHMVGRGRNQTQTPFCLQPIDLCTSPTLRLPLPCALCGDGYLHNYSDN